MDLTSGTPHLAEDRVCRLNRPDVECRTPREAGPQPLADVSQYVLGIMGPAQHEPQDLRRLLHYLGRVALWQVRFEGDLDLRDGAVDQPSGSSRCPRITAWVCDHEIVPWFGYGVNG